LHTSEAAKVIIRFLTAAPAAAIPRCDVRKNSRSAYRRLPSGFIGQVRAVYRRRNSWENIASRRPFSPSFPAIFAKS
jgi:hypothetical protein